MILTTLLFLLSAGPIPPAAPSPSPTASPSPSPRHTLLVLPLEASGGTTEAWVSEAVADQLPRSLTQLGVPAVSRAERLQAQAALEIPDVPLSRATSVRVAEALGATRLVTGTYAIEGARITLALRLLDVERATLSAPLISSGPIEGMMDLIDHLAWDVALAGPTPPAQSRDVLLAARPKVSFEVFKAYARGLAARDPKARATLLRSALAAAPGFDAVRLALGRLLLEQREFSAASQTLARVPAASPLAREAYFVRGVALLEIGRYREASRVYSGLAQAAPTPGALNNYALAVLRDPVPNSLKASDILRQALALDPESVDLSFNLAWALLAEDDAAGAAFQLKSLTQVVPLDKHTRVVLAWALRRAGREQEADRQWQAVGPGPGVRDPGRPRPLAEVREDPAERAPLRAGAGEPQRYRGGGRPLHEGPAAIRRRRRRHRPRRSHAGRVPRSLQPIDPPAPRALASRARRRREGRQRVPHGPLVRRRRGRAGRGGRPAPGDGPAGGGAQGGRAGPGPRARQRGRAQAGGDAAVGCAIIGG